MPVDVLPLRLERASIPIPHPVSLRGESKLCWWAVLGKDCGVDEGVGAGLAVLGRNSWALWCLLLQPVTSVIGAQAGSEGVAHAAHSRLGAGRTHIAHGRLGDLSLAAPGLWLQGRVLSFPAGNAVGGRGGLY